MRYKKIIRLSAVAIFITILVSSPVLAQDAGGASSIEEGFSVDGNFDESDRENSQAAEIAGENNKAGSGGNSAGAPETGFSSFVEESSGSTGTSPLEWGGMVEAAIRVFIDEEAPENSLAAARPPVNLGLHYTGDHSEAVAEITTRRLWNIDTSGVEQDLATQDISWYIKKVINQASLRLFYENFNLQAGYLKEVWGTGDQIHVVDPLNPIDYYDFVNNDYIDRKVAEFMLKGNIPLGLNGLIELVYVPTFTPDFVPLTGKWAPAEAVQLGSAIEAGAALHRPETQSISDGQYAARLSGSFGGFDIAGTYYYGFFRTPRVEIQFKLLPLPPQPENIYLSYDRLHLFGIDMAGVLAGFNLRGEVAAYLLEDQSDSTATWENKSSIQYIAGIDRNLPLSNLNINIQAVGAYYLDEAEDPTHHTVSAALTDSWNHDHIKPEVSASYGVEEEDWMVRPSIGFTLIDDVELHIEYAIFAGGSEGSFGQYDDNDYAEVRFTYMF